MNTNPWQSSPLPATSGPAREWQVTSAAQLHFVRAEVRAHLRSAAGDPSGEDPSGKHPSGKDPAGECVLATIDELATNGLIHGVPPVTASVSAIGGGWLVDISDRDIDHPPRPAEGRDPARGGMGLHLVAALSASRGWCVVGGRKHVWAHCQ